MSHFFRKTITDPIHGNIGLSKLEAEIASSRVFQRLHNVRQLGLAHLVFPGANYSRYAHSVGALHNASQLLAAIGRNTGKDLPTERIQAVRLAALLHDLGHYPFSHTTEHVIADYYVRKVILSPVGAASPTGRDAANTAQAPSPIDRPPAYDHEALGRVILENDPELAEICKRNGFSIGDIQKVYSKTEPNNLLPIISSDLDCDRLDYLRRTAHFSGAPYGSVDIKFLIDQATLDKEGRFCFGHKALRAADHLLVSRYYDYMQVPFHKTVASLEWSLSSAIRSCLDAGIIDCSANAVLDQITNGSWFEFDDQHVFEGFKVLQRKLKDSGKAEDALARDHLTSIMNRKSARLIAAWEEVLPRRDVRRYTDRGKSAMTAAGELANKHGIDPNRFHVWRETKSLSSVSMTNGNFDESETAKAIHILNKRNDTAELLITRPQALLHQLADHQYAGVRVYLLGENGHVSTDLRANLCSEFEDRVGQTTAA